MPDKAPVATTGEVSGDRDAFKSSSEPDCGPGPPFELEETGIPVSATVGFSTFGLHAATSFELGSTPVTAKGTLGWQHAFGDVVPPTSFSYAGGTSFAIRGLPIAQDAAVVDAGLDFEFTPGTTLGLSYDARFGNTAADQGVHGTLSVKF